MRAWRGGRLRGGLVVQERIAGLPCSAAAVADGRSAALLGVSEQLIGRRALGARGFAWCGNVVPPRLPAAERQALADAARAICAHLAAAFGLRGLFGVDMVWDGERAWVVEVNPRPTASLETIDAAYGVRSFAAHLEGCAGRLPAASALRTGAAGKAVLFATEDVRAPDTRGWPDTRHPRRAAPGRAIAADHPICTLVATGRSPEAVLADLEARAAALRAELHHRAGRCRRLTPAATCAGCGLVCDDITAVVDERRGLERLIRTCPLGDAWFADRVAPAPPLARVDGHEAALERALDEAAAILGRARAPLVYGLGQTTLRGAAGRGGAGRGDRRGDRSRGPAARRRVRPRLPDARSEHGNAGRHPRPRRGRSRVARRSRRRRTRGCSSA